jgi:hypothetical protein
MRTAFLRRAPRIIVLAPPDVHGAVPRSMGSMRLPVPAAAREPDTTANATGTPLCESVSRYIFTGSVIEGPTMSGSIQLDRLSIHNNIISLLGHLRIRFPSNCFSRMCRYAANEETGLQRIWNFAKIYKNR